MAWRMRLDLRGDDTTHPTSRARTWGVVGVVVLLVSLWIVGVTVLAVWLAGLVAR